MLRSPPFNAQANRMREEGESAVSPVVALRGSCKLARGRAPVAVVVDDSLLVRERVLPTAESPRGIYSPALTHGLHGRARRGVSRHS